MNLAMCGLSPSELPRKSPHASTIHCALGQAPRLKREGSRRSSATTRAGHPAGGRPSPSSAPRNRRAPIESSLAGRADNCSPPALHGTVELPINRSDRGGLGKGAGSGGQLRSLALHRNIITKTPSEMRVCASIRDCMHTRAGEWASSSLPTACAPLG